MTNEQYQEQIVWMGFMTKIDTAYDVLEAIPKTYGGLTQYSQIPEEFRRRLDDLTSQVSELCIDLEKERNRVFSVAFEDTD